MCEFRIHIVVPTGIFDLNGLHFMAVWIAIALTMHCHHRPDGNGVLLQAGRSGAERGRQRDVPNLAVRGPDLHGAGRAGELDSFGDRAGHGGDFIDVSAPAVMCKGRNGGCNGNGGGEHDCVQAHDILLSWAGGLCRNPWVTGRLKFARRYSSSESLPTERLALAPELRSSLRPSVGPVWVRFARRDALALTVGLPSKAERIGARRGARRRILL